MNKLSKLPRCLAPWKEPLKNIQGGSLFVWGYKLNRWPEIQDLNSYDEAVFKPASVPSGSRGNRLKFKDAAAGWKHVVALAEDGSLWSTGEGVLGQLGLGLRQFGLCTEIGVIDMEANETEEEFAVNWEKMEMDMLEGKECQAVFCEPYRTFVLVKTSEK